MPALLMPLAAFANDDEEGYEQDSEHIIGPSNVEEMNVPQMSDPINVENIRTSNLTPADHFVNATTPLVLALGLGSLGLVIYTLIRSSENADKD
jgi:hypothetical protein